MEWYIIHFYGFRPWDSKDHRAFKEYIVTSIQLDHLIKRTMSAQQETK